MENNTTVPAQRAINALFVLLLGSGKECVIGNPNVCSVTCSMVWGMFFHLYVLSAPLPLKTMTSYQEERDQNLGRLVVRVEHGECV